jgi:hypothetical protein
VPQVPRWKSHGINGKSDGSFGSFGTFGTSDGPLGPCLSANYGSDVLKIYQDWSPCVSTIAAMYTLLIMNTLELLM